LAKARIGQAFTPDEKEFLVEPFEAFGTGGRVSAFSEASQLVSHYVEGNGKTVRVDSDVYSSSTIVKDVMTVMKVYAAEKLARTGNAGAVAAISSEAGLLRRSDFMALMDKRRDIDTQGRVLPGGWLLAEQNNQRLQKTNNRFLLQGVTQKSSDGANRYTTSGAWMTSTHSSLSPRASKPRCIFDPTWS
jgi:hypothetical protein